ncbi:zinc metalloprotease HtpX [Acidobacteriota bacterium]
MYEQIAANKRKSIFLILFFLVLIFALAWAFGQITDFGRYAIIPAAVLAVFMTWGSYYYSDRIALRVSRARPVSKDEYPYLYNVVEGLAIAAGIPKPRCYVIDDTAPNAFASGRNPENAVVVVTTGILEKLNRAELEGVIAHELSHIKNYDILVQTLAVVMVGVIVLLSDWILRTFLWGGGRRRRSSSEKGGGNAGAILVIVALALAVLSPLFAQLLRLAVSRKREFLADADGAMLTRYPAGLASALRKLSADTEPLEAANKATAHMYIVNPLKGQKHGGGAMAKLFSTHPPIEERVAALEKM